MLKKIIPILSLSGCSLIMNSDDYFVTNDGEKILYSEVAKEVPFNHNPDLFLMQVYAQAVVAKEICTDFTEANIKMLDIVIEQAEKQINVYQEDKEVMSRFSQFHEGLKRHYRKEEKNKICENFKEKDENINKYIEG